MTGLAVLMAASLVLVPAAPASAPPGQADLAVTAAFDKPAFFASEDIGFTVTVTNLGTAPATGVTLLSESEAPFESADWAAFNPYGEGATVAPGERVELAGVMEPQGALDVLHLSVEVRTPDPDADPANNRASASTGITVRVADLTGFVYGDRDGDRTFDPGEALQGVLVEAVGGMSGPAAARTDQEGRFVIAGMPEGSYSLVPNLPGAWELADYATAVVRPDAPPTAIRAVRGSTALRSTITFDKAAYAPGEAVRERVTLTNTGTEDLFGVTARCVEGGAPNQLSGLRWGDLVHHEAAGVALRAGETRTFDFTDVVPPGGLLFGYITITCWFSTAFRYDDGPRVVARAAVPGGKGTSGGILYVDRDGDYSVDDGETLSHVKVYLVAEDGTITARTETDAAGRFRFADVAAGDHLLRVVGPWRARDGTDLRMGVYDGNTVVDFPYAVEPGPHQPDPDLPPPSTVDVTSRPAPAPQAVPRPANLADTGASVVELTALGVLLMLVGGGLLLVRVPRREP